jgi:hypothetical protein
MKHIHDHTWETLKPTPIQIGKPALRPPADVFELMRNAVSSTGATMVYWFWMSIDGDRPHLGLAVAPPVDEMISRIGAAIEPLWKQYSPNNSVFDILRLGVSNLGTLIMENGELLFEQI